MTTLLPAACYKMPITLNDAVRIPDRILFRELQGESVILNLETGVYFGLDAVGTAIWRLLGEDRTLRAVYDAMLHQYDVAPDVLERELLRLVEELQQNALVQVHAERT